MWIYFDQNQTVQKQLIHGIPPRQGVVGSFEIYAYFHNVDIEDYCAATIKFSRPDGTTVSTSYFLTKQQDTVFQIVSPETPDSVLPFVNGQYYDVYKFVANDVELFSQVGTYKAVITLYNSTGNIKSGQFTLTVQAGIDPEEQESITRGEFEEIMEQFASYMPRTGASLLGDIDLNGYKIKDGDASFTFNNIGLGLTGAPALYTTNNANLGTSDYTWNNLFLSGKINNLTLPTGTHTLATTDQILGLYLPIAGGTMTGNLDMSTKSLIFSSTLYGINIMNGIIDPTTKDLYISSNGNLVVFANALMPRFDNSKDLGHPNYRWQDLFLSGKINNLTLPTGTNTLATVAEVDDVRAIAAGKNKAYVVNVAISTLIDPSGNTITVTDDTDPLVIWMERSTLKKSVSEITDISDIKVGDNLFIVQTNLPDFWAFSVTAQASDKHIISFRRLETKSIDLSEYQKITGQELDSQTTQVVAEFKDNTEQTFKSTNISSVKLTIPEDIAQGFMGVIAVMSSGISPSLTIDNESGITYKLVKDGEAIPSYSISDHTMVEFTCQYNGIIVCIYINDVDLV